MRQYSAYEGSPPHFLAPYASSMGMPDTRVMSRKMNTGDSTDGFRFYYINVFIETIVYKRTFSHNKNYCLKYNIYLKAKFVMSRKTSMGESTDGFRFYYINVFIEAIVVYKRTFSPDKNYCLKYNIYLKAKFTNVTIRLKTFKKY